MLRKSKAFLCVWTLILMTSVASAGTCVESIPGVQLYGGKSDKHREMSDSLCEACKGQTDKKKRTSCMNNGLNKGWEYPTGTKVPSAKERYTTALKDWVKISIGHSKPKGYKVSDEEVKSAMNEVEKECPGVSFYIMNSTSGKQAGKGWVSDRDCASGLICKGDSGCAGWANLSSKDLENAASEVVQSKAAMEAVYYGKSLNNEVWDFSDSSPGDAAVVAPPVYPTNKNKVNGYKNAKDYLDKAKAAEKALGEKEEAEEEGVKKKLGCSPSDGTKPVGEGGEAPCIQTGYEGELPVLLKTAKDVNDALNKLVYRDLARFAAKRVWEAYTVALLSDPAVTGANLGCGSPEGVQNSIELTIANDAHRDNGKDRDTNLANLKKCFGGDPKDYNRSINQLGMGPRIDSLVKTGREMRCNGSIPKPEGSSCSKPEDTDDKGEGKKSAKATLLKRVEDLKNLEERKENLKKGKLNIGGTQISCKEMQGGCESFIGNMEACAPEFRVSQGCTPPTALTGEYALAWAAWKNLGETKNYILSKNPELAVQMTTVNKKKGYGSIKKEAWEVIYETAIEPKDKDGMCPYNGSKISCAELVEKQVVSASQVDRSKKLGFIADEICGDPEAFAKKILMGNPEMVNEFMQDSASKDLRPLLCVGLVRAKQDEETDKNLKMVAHAAAGALAVAGSIPTGGASVAAVAAIEAAEAAATVANLTLSMVDLHSAYDRMKTEVGMHHGCIGDYNKAKKSEEELEDAALDAAIDMAKSVWELKGKHGYEKYKKLNEWAESAKGVEKAEPNWWGKVKNKGKALKENYDKFDKAVKPYKEANEAVKKVVEVKEKEEKKEEKKK